MVVFPDDKVLGATTRADLRVACMLLLCQYFPGALQQKSVTMIYHITERVLGRKAAVTTLIKSEGKLQRVTSLCMFARLTLGNCVAAWPTPPTDYKAATTSAPSWCSSGLPRRQLSFPPPSRQPPPSTHPMPPIHPKQKPPSMHDHIIILLGRHSHTGFVRKSCHFIFSRLQYFHRCCLFRVVFSGSLFFCKSVLSTCIMHGSNSGLLETRNLDSDGGRSILNEFR